MVAYGVHGDGGEHLGFLADCLQSRREGEGVNHGGKHAHLVTLDAVEALGGSLHATEDVASANHDGHLHSRVGHGLDLSGVFLQALRIDAVMLLTHQRLPAEFQQYSLIFCSHVVVGL